MLDDYNCNIDRLHNFLANELKDSIIIPVLTSNIAIKSGNADYSNFAYSNFELNCNIDADLESNMTTDLNKSKLKHSIIKNIAYTNEIKTRQSAEDHFNNISNNKLNDIDYQDRITYYVDFVNDFKLLNDVINDAKEYISFENCVSSGLFKKLVNIILVLLKVVLSTGICKNNRTKE